MRWAVFCHSMTRALLVSFLSGCAVTTARELPALDCGLITPGARPKLLFLAVDGVRSDALEIAGTPRLDALAARGSLRLDTRAVDIPKSGPGWSTVFTGVWRDRHGVDSNQFIFHDFSDQPDLIARLERARPELNTAFIHSWPALDHFAVSADYRRECGDPEGFDECALDEALVLLGRADVDALVLYLRSTDELGHAFGFHPDAREYVERLRWIDGALGKLVDRIEHRCSFASEKWLVLSMTDHGGGGERLKSHGFDLPVEREVFSLVAHLGGERFEVFPAPAQTDFAPTALAHFGVTPQGLDGRVLSASSRPAARFDANLIFNPSAELDRGQSDFDVDGVVSGWEENGGVAPIVYGAKGAPTKAEVDGAGFGDNFFAGATRNAASLVQRIDVSALALEGARFEASALLGGWSDQEDAAEMSIRFLRKRERRAAYARHGEVVLFSGDRYQRVRGDAVIEAGAIRGAFDCVTGPIDGQRSGEALAPVSAPSFLDVLSTLGPDILSGRSAPPPRDVLSLGGPSILEGRCALRLPIDGAFWAEREDRVYLISGDRAVRFDPKLERCEQEGPIGELFPHLGLARVDAAVGLPQGRAAFFAGDQFVIYDLTARRALGPSLAISPERWPGARLHGVEAALEDARNVRFLGEERFEPERTVRLGPIGAGARGDRTALLRVSASGAVPEGTTEIEVEVAFSVTEGVGDGYADELSLVLRRAP